MDNKDLLSKLDRVKNNIKELRSKLFKTRNQRELEYKKLTTLREEIKSLSQQLRQLKSQNDKTNTQLSKIREERDRYNNKVKREILQLQELRKQQRNLISKNKRPFNSDRLRKTVEQLEYKIETEALSPKIEDQLMKKIKAAKKELDEGKDIIEIQNKIKEKSDLLSTLREKANKFHANIKKLQKEQTYEQFKDRLKNIQGLREKQDIRRNSFLKFKDNYNLLDQKLKMYLKQSQQIRYNLNNIQKNKRLQKEKEQKQKLQAKAVGVEEKIKKRQKLTKEDILAFQQNEPV